MKGPGLMTEGYGRARPRRSTRRSVPSENPLVTYGSRDSIRSPGAFGVAPLDEPLSSGNLRPVLGLRHDRGLQLGNSSAAVSQTHKYGGVHILAVPHGAGPGRAPGVPARSYLSGGESKQMANLTEQRLGFGFGILGGGLVVLAGVVRLITGMIQLASGRAFGGLNSETEAVVLFVVGGLAMLFAFLAHYEWKDRPIVGGVLLVVLAALGWGALGLGSDVIALIGAIFVLLAGVLFLLGPAKTILSAPVTA